MTLSCHLITRFTIPDSLFAACSSLAAMDTSFSTAVRLLVATHHCPLHRAPRATRRGRPAFIFLGICFVYVNTSIALVCLAVADQSPEVQASNRVLLLMTPYLSLTVYPAPKWPCRPYLLIIENYGPLRQAVASQ